MFTPMNIAEGSVYIALMMAVWKYAGNAYEFVMRFFVTTIRLDSYRLELSIIKYINEECKPVSVSIQDSVYGSTFMLIPDMAKEIAIAYKDLSNSSLFMYGRVPILLESKSKDNDWSYQIKFIRGMLNPDDLIIEAMNLYNKAIDSTKERNRFFIENACGSIGDPRVVMGAVPTCKDSEENLPISDALRNYLGFTDDQIFGNKNRNMTMKNLYFNKNVWESVRNMRRWKESKDWYLSKSIPWKMGWLLYGPPGTGKSSLVRSIGEYLNMPVISFNLRTFTDVDFVDKWSYVVSNSPCIALIEDIDAVFNKRENVLPSTDSMKSLSFNCLLNCIDGVSNSNGVFTVITTNNIDSIDEALASVVSSGSITSRPGRIDEVIRLGNMDTQCRHLMAERILSDCKHEIKAAVEETRGMTPSQVQRYCERIALDFRWKNLPKRADV